RKTLPLQPARAAVRSDIGIFFTAFDCARQNSAMSFAPALGKVRKDFVVRSAGEVLSLEIIVCKKTITHLDVTHVSVEHRDRSRSVFDKQAQQCLLVR